MTTHADSRRILVVEDEMLVAMMLEDMLGALGHHVVGPMARIEPALVAVAAERLDAALLDVNLDGREVYPVAEALAARSIPIAFVTGYDSAGLRTPWTGWPILEKPFRQSDLERILSFLFDAP